MAIIILFANCKKEEVIVPAKEKDIPISKFEYEEGKFKREIVVKDKTGKNKVFYAIYSDDEQVLSDFLVSNELSLEVNVEEDN